MQVLVPATYSLSIEIKTEEALVTFKKIHYLKQCLSVSDCVDRIKSILLDRIVCDVKNLNSFSKVIEMDSANKNMNHVVQVGLCGMQVLSEKYNSCKIIQSNDGDDSGNCYMVFISFLYSKKPLEEHGFYKKVLIIRFSTAEELKKLGLKDRLIPKKEPSIFEKCTSVMITFLGLAKQPAALL